MWNLLIVQGVIMHKSIFFKYFTMFSSMVIMCIVILGLCFVYVIFNQIMQQEHSRLSAILDRSLEIIFENYNYETDTFDELIIYRYCNGIAKSSGVDFIFSDVNGQIQYCTNEKIYDVNLQNNRYISSDIVSLLRNSKKYTEYGVLGGLYDKRVFTVGNPLNVNNQVIGNIFCISEDNTSDNIILFNILKVFVYCALIVLIGTFIVVYFVTHQMIKPLKDMSSAAKRFAIGDFSEKIEVTSLDEVGQLALAMNSMAQSLELSENAHKSFIANVSHELRTPMTSISGFVDGILDGTIPKEREVYYLNIVSDEIKRLSRLVRTMLNLSRIENGELKLETARVNIVDIICEILFTFEKEIDRKEIQLDGIGNSKVFVIIDYDLMHQVLYNLIENAIKFVDEGGCIKFTYDQKAKTTIIGIENSGKGLTKDEIPKVFDRFYKTDNSRGIDKNGVGLGLHIVRSIVNLHGGEVMVRSEEGKYCKFSFDLPNIPNDKNFDELY